MKWHPISSLALDPNSDECYLFWYTVPPDLYNCDESSLHWALCFPDDFKTVTHYVKSNKPGEPGEINWRPISEIEKDSKVYLFFFRHLTSECIFTHKYPDDFNDFDGLCFPCMTHFAEIVAPE